MPPDNRTRIALDATHDLLGTPEDLKIAARLIRSLAQAGRKRRFNIIRYAYAIVDQGDRVEEVLRAANL